ncbi:MAG: sensor domain-containing diguanylate cyclase [Spirochaetaceae bacterium]|nr:MAG: sensor domain-containing diguanylate cyclase [Spirochaetaceae bacterium]
MNGSNPIAELMNNVFSDPAFEYSKRRGCFVDSEMEQQYDQVRLATVLPLARLAVVLLALVGLAFLYVDYHLIGWEPRLLVPASYRVGLAVFAAAVIRMSYRERDPERFYRVMTVFQVCFLLSVPLILLLRDPRSPVHVAVMVTGLLAVVMLLPNRQWFSFVVALIGTAVYLAVCVLYLSLSPQDLFTAFFMTIGTLIATVFILTRTNVESHRGFAALVLERRASERLSAEVEERKRLEYELQHQATTDLLTGLPNRRGLQNVLESEFDRCVRYDRPFGILMIDVDHFKQVNDTYGHEAGDVVLQELSSLMRGVLRSPDSLGRYGGEEFIAILAESSDSQTIDAASRLIQQVSNVSIAVAQTTIQVTVSVGASVRHASDTSVDAVIRRADAALYRAKRAGRNQVCIEAAESGCLGSI